jgi:succinyl-CoA synthetase beta subunit
MGRTLSEHESKLLIAEHGVPVVADRVVGHADEAVRTADELGYPVVVKLTGELIAHKTERGLVRLSLGSSSEVEVAARELLAAVRPEDGDVALLVAPMLCGTRELIAGIHRDQDFGLCVMIGIGGVLAEAVADVVFRLVPIDETDADDMLDELRGQAMLGPVRGEPALDRSSAIRVLVALSQLASSRGDLLAVDVNPLVIVDGVPVAVDALVELDDALG